MVVGFFSGPIQCDFPVAIVTGVCRSGKTLLANALATCCEVEAADEPWTAMMLPMVAHHGLVADEAAKLWFSTYLCELLNDLVLMRRANFRPTDLSSIWTKKTSTEIFGRLSQLQSRVDVQNFIHQNMSTLLVTLAECSPFADFLISAVPQARLIHVVRDGFDVAGEVERKEWFSNKQLRSPANAQLCRPYESTGDKFFLPWWVPKSDSDTFLALTEFERGMYYWCSLMEPALRVFGGSHIPHLLVRYEALVRDPYAEFERSCKFLDFSAGELTEAQLAKISPRQSDTIVRFQKGPLFDRVRELNNYIEKQSHV